MFLILTSNNNPPFFSLKINKLNSLAPFQYYYSIPPKEAMPLNYYKKKKAMPNRVVFGWQMTMAPLQLVVLVAVVECSIN
jgi:hypothetical protein